MKASLTTTVVLKSFDLELKALLKQDIKRFKADHVQANNQFAKSA